MKKETTENKDQKFVINYRLNKHLKYFINGKNVRTYTSKGTATPDHVIRVKPFPLIITPKKNSSIDDFKKTAEKAFKNNWSGVVVNGCIRDSDIIKNIDIGVLALSTNPQKSEKKDIGEVNIELNFFNTSFIPGHYLYADLDGLLVSKTKIDI